MLGISSLDAYKLLHNIVRYNNLQYFAWSVLYYRFVKKKYNVMIITMVGLKGTFNTSIHAEYIIACIIIINSIIITIKRL